MDFQEKGATVAFKKIRYAAVLSMSGMLVSLCLTVFADASHAATIEVYPGTDVFARAAQSLSAGDTLIVHQGTYNETSRTSLQVRGTATTPIVIRGADGEAKPLITRPASASVQNTINIEGSATYLTIKGLEIAGNGGDGINMSGTVSYITLEDLDIHDVDVGVNFRNSMGHITVSRNHIHRTGIDGGTGEGMYIGCNNATCVVSNSIIEGNWIHDVLPGTTQGDGIEVKVGSHSNVIRDNVIYNMTYPGILVYGTGANPVNLVEGNVVWNCSEGIVAFSDAIVRNNIVFNSGSGVGSYGHVQVASRKNVIVLNNTLYNNDSGVYLRWGGTNMTLANNAIYSPGKTAVNSSSGITGTVRSNYVEGSVDIPIDNSAFFSGGSAGSAFASAASNEFWPGTGSPLIGTADSSFVATADFNDTARVSPYDVGAYETNGQSINPGWKIVQGFKAVPGSVPAAPVNLRVH